MTEHNHPLTRRWPPGIAFLGAATALVLVLAACGSSGSKASTTKSSSPTADQTQSSPASSTSITFSLDYLTDGLHAPVYVAQSKQYFSSSGLKVSIEPSNGSQDSITRVATGEAQMGFADAGTVVKAMATQHVPVTVVGILLKTEPFSTITLKSEGITQPSQLKGKSIGDAPATSDHAFLKPFLDHIGLTSADVSQVSLSLAELVPALLDKKVDAIDDYAQVFAKYASQVNILPWSHYGINPYGTAFIVNNSFLAKNGTAVSSFLKDTYRGLAYTVANPDSAASIVAAASPGSSVAYFQAELPVLTPYWVTANSSGVYGEMTDPGWTNTQKLNLSTGVQSSSVPVSQIYTNKYLK